MKKKLLTLFLSVMSVFFVFGAKVSAETISVVSDTAYAPFEFKDSDQTYKGIDVDIINEVAKRKNWDVNQTFPGSMQLSMLFNQAKLTPLWPVLLLPTHVRRSLLSQTLITTPQLLSTHVVAIKSATTNN